ETTDAFDAYDYSRVLQRTESFFWRFCDAYLELVKGRRYGEQGPEGAASANSALTAALSVMLRLFAPFLPFVTEEVWSWWQEGSIHAAPWPVTSELDALLADQSEATRQSVQATYDWATDVLFEVRKQRSEAKQPLKVPITRVIVKAPCVLAGMDVAIEAFRQLEDDVAVTLTRHDGDCCAPGEAVGEVAGSARALLIGERTALNFLQRLSGIATRARRFVEAAGGRITILDTRKTTPTLRALEKYAVRVGGASNHRVGLYDAILIKDNHIRLSGGVQAAIDRARAQRPGMPLEIEAETLAQVDEALASRAETILVDNMSAADIIAAAARVRGRAKVEISGGVTLE